MSKKWIVSVVLVVILAGCSGPEDGSKNMGHKTGDLFELLEWSINNPGHRGNAFDLVSTVKFTHTGSGETIETKMFYNGGNEWRFRFTGDKLGNWTFSTSSTDPDLDGLTGTISINNYTPGTYGFVKHDGDKWVRQKVDGNGNIVEEAFTPQFFMGGAPHYYFNNSEKIEEDVQELLVEQGFSGFSTGIHCRWFHIDNKKCDMDEKNPDIRTFEAIEDMLSETNKNGKMIHFFKWGDTQRTHTCDDIDGGCNGYVDKRLQRYIAARLGPLPGWTMSYGYDLDEWTNEDKISEWHDYMHSKFGWPHMLGARPEGPNHGTDHSEWITWNEKMDYSSYEHHRPDYDVYVAALENVPGQPVISEDRFRTKSNKHPEKDYTEEMTRRGLWISTMAGGVGNVWGNLEGADCGGNLEPCLPYEDKDKMKTYFDFWENRFSADLERCNELTDGYCLKTSDNKNYIFYKEKTSSIQIDLSGTSGSQKAAAVDANESYTEIVKGALSPGKYTIDLGTNSDWAIAVGDLDSKG
ncbi:MAG: DUF5060 domain-containing protein [Halobacteriota archaeon]